MFNFYHFFFMMPRKIIPPTLSRLVWKRGYRNIADQELQALDDRAYRSMVYGLPASFLSIVLFIVLAGVSNTLAG